ncbi:MAG: glycoside hydrolase family 16 protein [Rhizobiaceae bacterium]
MTASLDHRLYGKLGTFVILLAAGAAVPALAAPSPAPAQSAAKPAKATGKSFVDDFDRLDRKRWYISDGWNNGKHQNCTWSKEQVKQADGKLTLEFAKRTLKERDHVCGEIQTKKRFGYGTYEVRMKAAAGSGLNTGFFTYIGSADKEPHDEIDFEVLGKDPSKVQLNQFVDGKNVGEQKLVPVGGGADRDFHDYAFIWEKDRIRWYVDGKQMGEATDPAKIPTHPSKIFISIWGSDTLKSWMGPFSDFDRPVSAEIDRVAFTALGEKCQFPQSVACKLD